mgnify:CR=1 FL=1
MKFKLLSLLTVIASTACAQETRTDDVPIVSNTNYTYEVIVPELTNPWGMDLLPDGSLLITEKSGELIHFKDGSKTQITGVPAVVTRNQGGLLDVRLHPDFKKNNQIYLQIFKKYFLLNNLKLLSSDYFELFSFEYLKIKSEYLKITFFRIF